MLGLSLLVVWAAAIGIVVAAHRKHLHASWREPVFAAPVLIIESDDWGPGPPPDAERLRRLAAVLAECTDSAGRRSVATLGIVLAVPGAADPDDSGPVYLPRTLEAPEFAPLRQAMLAGRDAGVFALQLHAMEHFWPPALQTAAAGDAAVRSFLGDRNGVPRHETLPSHLQARWVDASRLPTTPLDRADIDKAVAEETACFARVFGEPARVAVPVTFTWNTDVEAAWAGRGIRVVVTPGTRNVGRDGRGRLVGDGSILRNGDTAACGIVYVVRDIYFEPALGHGAERTLDEIRAHHRLGRPALLETHRFNFTGDAAQAEHAYAELRRLLRGALAAIPALRFMSTEALAQAMIAGDSQLIDWRLAARVRALVLRAATQPRLRKLAWFSGLALVAAAALAVATALLPRPASGEGFRG
jgi:hypothetical protein